jgi:serine/threonine protein kinase
MMANDNRQRGAADARRPVPELDDPRVIEALDEYLAALEGGQRPDRTAFLARHADVAPALAECLDGMEALHAASSSSPQAVGPAAGPDWQPGTPLGDFRILREVGRGGMGVVYEAEQLSLGRRIALKVLPFALTLDPRQLQRFKNEARAAAQLHHPHIVPVHAVGQERGVHFYAMQFIEGQSLAEVIEGLRQVARPGKGAPAPGNPTARRASRAAPTGPFVARPEAPAAETVAEPAGALATAYSTNSAEFYRAVARLGVQAALALEHAHDCGVVHRDVKPGNLLLDAQGKLWVTDFGLAQFHEDAGLTQTGDLLGTLRYMSPEQAGGRRVLIDHRTDVYSLGSTLYELLTLRPAFGGADRQTLLHQILHEEPRPPRAVEKAVPAELETIILKALAKTPAERYGSARELADDLSRFLEHQPIRARRATPLQRAWKWGRRHPSLVAAGVALCLVTAAGSLVSAAMIRREQGRTQVAYEAERQRAREAEERFRVAREAVNEMLTVCEAELADRPDLDGLRRRLLERALAYYQRLIEERGDDPTALAELAATRARAKRILDDLAVMHGAWHLSFLQEPAVLYDLGLTVEQRVRLAEVKGPLDKRWAEAFHDFHRLSSEERRQRFARVARASDAELGAVLTQEQRGRLRQIALQVQGAAAFREPEVVNTLVLTAEQRERIRMIEADLCFDCPDGHAPGTSPEEQRAAHERKRREASQRILAVLTPDQARRWKHMTGRPYEGPVPWCPGGPS